MRITIFFPLEWHSVQAAFIAYWHFPFFSNFMLYNIIDNDSYGWNSPLLAFFLQFLLSGKSKYNNKMKQMRDLLYLYEQECISKVHTLPIILPTSCNRKKTQGFLKKFQCKYIHTRIWEVTELVSPKLWCDLNVTITNTHDVFRMITR